MRTPYNELPGFIQRLLRYNAMTPDEDRMPDRYAKMTKESLINQVSKLRKKRVKQLKKMDDFLDSLQ